MHIRKYKGICTLSCIDCTRMCISYISVHINRQLGYWGCWVRANPTDLFQWYHTQRIYIPGRDRHTCMSAVVCVCVCVCVCERARARVRAHVCVSVCVSVCERASVRVYRHACWEVPLNQLVSSVTTNIIPTAGTVVPVYPAVILCTNTYIHICGCIYIQGCIKSRVNAVPIICVCIATCDSCAGISTYWLNLWVTDRCVPFQLKMYMDTHSTVHI